MALEWLSADPPFNDLDGLNKYIELGSDMEEVLNTLDSASEAFLHRYYLKTLEAKSLDLMGITNIRQAAGRMLVGSEMRRLRDMWCQTKDASGNLRRHGWPKEKDSVKA